MRVAGQGGEVGHVDGLADGLVRPHHGGFAPQRDVVVLRLVGEDVESHLGPLLLDVLDEEGDLHGSPDLPPDGGDPGLVTEQGVHGDAVLDDQGRDGDQREDQHVEDEELLSTRS